MLKKHLDILAGAIGFCLSGAASAQAAPALPLSLTQEAIQATIAACADKGFRVATTVVDGDGVIKAQARGDGSPIHSQNFSFRKAYTVVSMGPMFGVDAGSALVAKLGASPQGLANVQSGDTPLLFLPGAALLKSGETPIGAIGVSGAPSSLDDEACARAAVEKLQPQLDRLQQ